MTGDEFFSTPPQSTGTYTFASPFPGLSPTSTSESSSTPEIMQSPQSEWGLMQSTLLQAMGDQMMTWSMDKIAKGEAITDQMVSQFIELSGKGKGLAQTIINQYQDQIKPLMDKWIRDAGSYASEGRQRFEAGQAMSTVAQADKAAMDEMARKIGDYGVNVNSGRYMDSTLAARTVDAAARAGAGTMAAERTEATGRQMQAQALNWGQNLPGMAINAVQSAYAGLTGAENSILGFMKTAGDLIQSAVAPFFKAAVDANKLPPVGNTQKSKSESPQQPQGGVTNKGGGNKPGEKQAGEPKEKQQPQPRGGPQGRGDGEGDRGPKDAWAPPDLGNQPFTEPLDATTGTGATPEGYYGTVPYVGADGNLLPQWSPETFTTGLQEGPNTPQWNEPGVSNWSLPAGYSNDPSGYNVSPGIMGNPNAPMNLNQTWEGIGQPEGLGTPPGGSVPNFREMPSGGPTDPNQPVDLTPRQRGWADELDDNNIQNANYTEDDPWGQQDFNNYNDADNYNFIEDNDSYNLSDADDVTDANDYSDYDDNSYYDDYNDSDYSDYDDSDYSDYDDNSYYDDYNDSDYSDYDDTSYADDSDYEDNSYYDDYYDSGYTDDSGYSDSYGGESYDGGDYAQGGAVRRMRGAVPTTGGPVPRSASPSRGRQTDDISARLNAGEYVIPRDVVKHQGTKFFTDLIQKSRKLRTGMAGAKPKPTMRPALPAGRPTFSSRPLPPR